MPQVPVYEGGAVADQGTTGARVEGANYGPGIGAGVAALGKATGDFVEKMDGIQALHDEVDAKQLDLQHQKFVAAQREALNKVRGADAQPAAEKLAKDLGEYDQGLLAQARSPRARYALENAITPRTVQHTEAMDAYANGQFVEHTKAVNLAHLNGSIDEAINTPAGTPAFEQKKSTIAAQIASSNAFLGEHDAAVNEQQLRQAMDKIYPTQAQAIYTAKGAAAARDFIEEHRGEMYGDTAGRLLAAYAPEATTDEMRQTFLASHGEPHIGGAAPPPAANDSAEPAKPGPPRTETMSNPADGLRISSGFGHRTAPTAGASSNHGGWDIPMPVGSEVNATLSGRVIFAGTKGGYGNTVIIDHGNGLRTQYSHLSSIEVKPGEQVDQDDEVAKSGSTGVSTGPHLHYQVWDHGVPADPSKYVSKDRTVAPGGMGGVPAHTAAAAPSGGRSLESDLELADKKEQSGQWSPMQAKAWRSVAQEWYGRADSARAKTEDDANRGAAAWLAAQPDMDKFTDIGQMPASIVAGMNPTTLLNYRRQAEANAKGDNIEVSPQTMWLLGYTKAADPQKYTSHDFFNSMVGKLPASQLRALAHDQGATLGEMQHPDPKHISDGDLLGMAKDPLFAAGIDLNPSKSNAPAGSAGAKTAYEQSNQVLNALRGERDAWEAQNPGKKADDVTQRKWLSNVLLNVTGSKHQVWNATDDEVVSQLTAASKDYISRGLRSAGQVVNNHTIAEASRRLYHMRNAGGR